MTTDLCELAAECEAQGCPEHPEHSGNEHTWEQHHDPADHEGPFPCLCTVYRDECAICVPGQCPGPDCPGNYSADRTTCRTAGEPGVCICDQCASNKEGLTDG